MDNLSIYLSICLYVYLLFIQIVVEEFLEDINNMLNSGEVPNLFPADEYEQIIAAVRPKAKDHGIAEGDRCVCMWEIVCGCVCVSACVYA